MFISTRWLAASLAAFFLCLMLSDSLLAAPRVSTPPLGERWFGIKMDTDQVGFYRQEITARPEGGFRVEGSGSEIGRASCWERVSNAR